MENRRVVKKTDRLYYFLVGLLIAVASITVFMILGDIFLKASQVPTVYMIRGDKDICRDAIDAEGNPTTCEKAMEDGRFDIIPVSPETLNGK